MKLVTTAILIVALRTFPQVTGQAPPTEDEAGALLEEAFAGTEASIVEIRIEEPRVVVPEEGNTTRFIVEAALSGIGDPFEVSAYVSSGRNWRLRYVEHAGLMMSADELIELIQRDRQRRTIEQMRTRHRIVRRQIHAGSGGALGTSSWST